MVNVKSYSCFPTMIYEFDGGMTKQNHANMLNILDFEKPDNNLHESSCISFLCKNSKRMYQRNNYISINIF